MFAKLQTGRLHHSEGRDRTIDQLQADDPCESDGARGGTDEVTVA